MKRKLLLAATVAAALWSASAFALPSTGDVEAAVKAGNYSQAETMMQEVVAAKPQSAKAHYTYAEILAHDAKFGEAVAQARRARELDPNITFTDPAKFHQFEQLLQREQGGGQAAPSGGVVQQPTTVRSYQQAASTGIPGWVWVGGLALLAFVIFRMVSRRAMGMAQPASYGGGGFAAPGGGYGMQPGYGQPGFGQSPGSGLLGTGLAAAGGVAAGMLVEKMLDERHDGYRDDRSGLLGGNTGGWDSGSGQAATELEDRPIDFGNGNDWGGDGGGGGGGSDNFTPSGDDGGW